MSFFEQIKGQVTSSMIGQIMSTMGLPDSPLLRATTELVMKAGGLSGLKERFDSQGLGNVFTSWLNPGSNENLETAQLEKIFGAKELQSSAHDNGIEPEQLVAHLSTLLPSLIDQLTPDGQIPSEPPSPNNILSTAFDLMKRSAH